MKFIIVFTFACLIFVSSATPKLSKHDVGELLLGILEGIIDDVPDIGPCLEDSGYDVEDIIKAVEDMRAGGAGNIAKGLKEIYDALATLPAIFKNCSGAIEEVEQLEAIFSSPYTFIMHSLRDILVNGINIADNLEAVFQDYDNQQWKQMGFQIGDMLEEIFIGGKSQEVQKLFDSSDVEQFLIGVLEGLVVDVPDIGPCIEDSGFDLEDIISAIEDIRSGIDDKSASEIGAGLEEIYKALKMLPSIYKDCSDAPEEIEKLEEIFSSPYTFAFHTVYDIIVNGIDIADEIEAMIQDYDNQEWKAMGFQVGDCLDKIFLGGEKNLVANSPKLSKHDVGELLLGILEGIIDDVPDIGPCLEDSGYDVEDIIKAVEDMRAGGPANIAKGLKEIYDALATLPAIFKNCSGAIEEVEQLEAIFSSPYTFIMHSLRDILVNGINIADNLEAVFQDYDNQQWKQMGFQIGDMLEEIFIGGKSQEVQKLFDSSDVEQFLIGVLEGLVVDVPDIGPCIEDSGFDLEDIISAIEDIRSGIDDKSASEIGAGLEEIYKALKMLPSIYKDCSDAPEEIEKLEEIFSSPYTFAFHTVYDIIVNGIDIADEIEAMIQDYDNQEWKAMGFQVGDCLDKIFLGGEKNLVANSPKLSKHDVGELLLGILEGIIDDVPDIGPCLEDSGYDVEDIIKAVEDMRAGGPANIAKGLKEIYDALATLPAIFKNCSGAIEEVEQLEAIFSSPYTFIMHSLRDILVNGINIADNLEAVFQDYDNQQWKQMGFQIGDMLEEIFIGGKSQVSNETPKLSKHDVGELLLGILEGIIDDVPDIGPCLEDSGYDVEDIIKAVEDMRAGGAGNIAKGLKEIYDALATLPAIFKNCSGAIEEVEQLEAIFSSPYTFIMHSLRDILVNGINIADNLEAVFQDYDNQQWKQMGFQIGDMLEEIFIGGKAQQIFNQ